MSTETDIKDALGLYLSAALSKGQRISREEIIASGVPSNMADNVLTSLVRVTALEDVELATAEWASLLAADAEALDSNDPAVLAKHAPRR